jgi:hypothetical protein
MDHHGRRGSSAADGRVVLNGTLNALARSPDGDQVVVAGREGVLA